MSIILVIDDKQDNLLSISSLLKNLIPGCRMLTAQSGPEGIEKAKAEPVDTILLDIHMPGMDGFEVCKILKSDEATKHIPIIMLTAVRRETESLVKGLELGADAFLPSLLISQNLRPRSGQCCASKSGRSVAPGKRFAG